MKSAIFLSASVPDPIKDPKYYQTADVTAIREAVRALATYILPKTTLIWGGHPAITPMIRVVADNLGVKAQERVIMYQSLYFKDSFPIDNEAFAHIELTPSFNTMNKSLTEMRKRMLTEHTYLAGVFIGGMKGVEDEYKMFKKLQPSAQIYPISSTGGAAQIIFNKNCKELPIEFIDDYSYFSLFRKFLKLGP